MKKLLTLLLALTMLMGLAGCKEKAKTVTVNIYGSGASDPDVFTVSQNVKTIKDVLDVMSTPSVFECTYEQKDGGVVIVSIKMPSAEYNKEDSTFEVTRNGKPITGTIDKEGVNDGDVVEIRYSEPVTEPEPVLGAWELFDKFNVVLTQEEKEIFEKATADMLSVKYEPIRVIATQVVNGTNYAYLVSQEKVVENPKKEFYIVKIYQDLEGNIDFKAINKLDPTNVVAKDVPEEVAGGWSVSGPDNSAILLDENAQSSFNKAAEGWSGVNLQPIQLLASQVVNGTNYIALCKGQTVTETPINGIYIVTWYAPLDGTPEISDVKLLDIDYYTVGE